MADLLSPAALVLAQLCFYALLLDHCDDRRGKQTGVGLVQPMRDDLNSMRARSAPTHAVPPLRVETELQAATLLSDARPSIDVVPQSQHCGLWSKC